MGRNNVLFNIIDRKTKVALVKEQCRLDNLENNKEWNTLFIDCVNANHNTFIYNNIYTNIIE